MIHLFFNKFHIPISQLKWMHYFEQMPKDIQGRIGRYLKEENKYQLLIGRLLLRYGMRKLGQKDFQLAALYYDKYNCPQWRESIQFNIAHSGNIVACAFSERVKIGVDVEKIGPIQLENFDHILNPLDYEYLHQSNNQAQTFFKIWTIKEAVTKAIGKGLSIDVKAIKIYDDYAILNQEKWYYASLDLAEAVVSHIVSDQPINQLIIKQIIF